MKAEIYSKPNCPYCDRSKALLTKLDIPYEEIDAVANIDILKERVTNITGAPPRTVPQIFLDGKYIGGFTDLEKILT